MNMIINLCNHTRISIEYKIIHKSAGILPKYVCVHYKFKCECLRKSSFVYECLHWRLFFKSLGDLVIKTSNAESCASIAAIKSQKS